MAGSEDGAFIVAAGDIATDYDYAALAEQAQSLSVSGDWAHLVMVANPTFTPKVTFGWSTVVLPVVMPSAERFSLMPVLPLFIRSFCRTSRRPCSVIPMDV